MGKRALRNESMGMLSRCTVVACTAPITSVYFAMSQLLPFTAPLMAHVATYLPDRGLLQVQPWSCTALYGPFIIAPYLRPPLLCMTGQHCFYWTRMARCGRPSSTLECFQLVTILNRQRYHSVTILDRQRYQLVTILDR